MGGLSPSPALRTATARATVAVCRHLWWAEEHHVVGLGGEVEGAEMGDDVALDRALEAEVEVLERLAGREARSFDPGLAAVVLAGRPPPTEGARPEPPPAPPPRAGSVRPAP